MEEEEDSFTEESHRINLNRASALNLEKHDWALVHTQTMIQGCLQAKLVWV